MAPSAVQVESSAPETNGVAFSKLNTISRDETNRTSFALRSFRCLIADLCQQFNGGHPGSAMGMAAIGIALWKYVMRYSPENPDFFNRDRFVLSNGHACLWQYTFLHLVGYSHMTMDQLKSYHSARTDSFCPGHPEIEHSGIEVTTGPLGQGVANAVGFALATKHLAATYNRPGYDIVKNTTWCMVGDACLQEGVALEAFQLAGHWRLNNLIVIYDNNQITCDGSVDMVNSSEDINSKMRACGWKVIEVEDGNYDVEGIVSALVLAKQSREKPVFVNISTVIGIGSQVAGDAKAHGVALGVEDVASVKKLNGFDPEQHFVVSDDVYSYFADIKERGKALEAEWNELLGKYGRDHPHLSAELTKRMKGEFTEDWRNILPAKEDLPTNPTSSRKSAGLICNPLAAKIKSLMVGTADLSPSVNMIWPDKVDFQHPSLRTAAGINGTYEGRYIHWGIREHAMASISNGLAAYNKGTILPVTSSFFMFYIYAAPGVRMGALQKLQAIHIATHDSIGTGEDGPTHQPIELAALYRAMPNLLYIRPCDSEEVAGAFTAALEAKNTPSMISLSRQNLDQFPQYSSRDGVQKGAYVFIEQDDADVTLMGVGSEMALTVRTRERLLQDYGLKARVVSFPCQRLFEAQSKEYRQHTLRAGSDIPCVIIEAYSVNGWERYADAGFSMHQFGHSLPGAVAYNYFGFDEKVIAPRVKQYLDEVSSRPATRFRTEFHDLNNSWQLR